MGPQTPGAESQARFISQAACGIVAKALIVSGRTQLIHEPRQSVVRSEANASGATSVAIAGDAVAEKAARSASHTIRLRGTWDVAGYRRLSSMLRDLAPDVVHVWDPHFLPAPALLAIVRGKRCPVVATFRHPPDVNGRPRIAAQLVRKHVAEAVADCEFVRAACLQRGWSDSAMSVIPAGCEQRGVESPETEHDALSDDGTVGFDQTARRIVVVGPLSAHKRIADLIWAVDMLAPLEPRLRLAIVGAGPAESHLHDASRAVRRADRVDFFSIAALPQLLDTAEFAAAPGDMDGCCQGTLQAMSWGLPIVAASGGGNRELIGEDVAGLTFPAGDRGELARTLWRMLENEELRKRLGAEAVARARNDYSAERMANAYADLYRGLLNM